MAATVEAFVNESLLIVGGNNFFLAKRLSALRADHRPILARRGRSCFAELGNFGTMRLFSHGVYPGSDYLTICN